jgi:hypothetical protein
VVTRAFLQTRGSGRAGDYTFLGHAPEEPWWRAYRDATAFDHPTVLVTSDGDGWAAYLSGIPSARVDAVGTVVRYTLVLDGPCGAAEADCVRAAVAAWCADVAAPDRPGDVLSTALDARFPGELVDRMITRPFPGGTPDATARIATDASLVHGHVLEALRALPVPRADAGEPGDWLGGVGAPACRDAFVARVGLLLAGERGRALLLNLVAGPDDAGALLDDAPLAVLVEGARPARPALLRPVVEAKKAPAAAASRAGALAARTETVTVYAMMAVALLVATVAAIVLLL